MSARPLRSSTQLRVSGVSASWHEDPERPGAWVLYVGPDEQSTLLPERPRTLVYEYLARIGAAVDLAAPAGTPLRVLHLGGGALTLPRYVEATRPGSEQVVVDLDAELMPFVLESFPLAEPARTRVIIGDVREKLTEAVRDGAFDVIVFDIALGPDSPERLLEESFYRELLAALAPAGLLLVNVGDEPPLATTRQVAAALSGGGASVWVSAQADMMTGRYAGNLIVGASRQRWDEERLAALTAAGPHPAGLAVGLDINGLGQ